eukprot:1177708-Prorocentrum_minimum.AAC.1
MGGLRCRRWSWVYPPVPSSIGPRPRYILLSLLRLVPAPGVYLDGIDDGRLEEEVHDVVAVVSHRDVVAVRLRAWLRGGFTGRQGGITTARGELTRTRTRARAFGERKQF